MQVPPLAKKLLGGALVGLAASVVVILLHSAKVFDHVEWKSVDWRQRLAAAAEPPGAGARAPVAAIYLGDASIAAAKRPENDFGWPWPRSIWGCVLDLLRHEGSRAAAFDIFFAEKHTLAEQDDLFAASIRAHGDVYLATMFKSAAAAPPEPAELERIRALAVSVTAERPADLALFPEAGGVDSPSLADFLRAARGIGNAAAHHEFDSIHRRVTPLVRFEGRFYPTLALAVAHGIAGGGEIRITADRHLEYGSGAGRRRLPLERDGTLLLRFGRAVREVHDGAVEAFDAFVQGSGIEEGRAPQPLGAYVPGALAGKAVFIGYSASGLYDLKPNPIMGVAPAMLVHVAATENLLAGRALETWTRRTVAPLHFVLVLLGVMTGALVAGAPSVKRQVAAAALLAGMWFGVAVHWSFPRGVVVDLVAPEAAIMLAFTNGALLNYVLEGRQRARIKDAFQHYLSPVFVEELLRDPSKLKLGGERRELTIFFSDLAGFTTLSERLSPEDLVKILNVYLTRMTEIVLRHGGTHDKYIGDAVMAFYGAPLPVADHAALACVAALEQQRAIDALNAEWAAQGLPTVLARMGINTGEVVVGNMGSEQTMDYTVMGDAVNLASRLEGANKPFGTLIMAGERTEALARHRIEFRELAGLKVKGKTRPVKVYEVLGVKGETPPARIATARRFEEALRLFERKEFGAAAAIFEDLAKKDGDEPSKLYLEQCAQYAAEGAPEDWEGVVALTSK